VDAILDGQPEPPLYFARMKRLNRDGVPPLDALPQPRALGVDDLGALPEGAVVLDTRRDRSAFMAQHLPGALYAPFDKQFNTVAGSYVTDVEAPVILIIGEADVEEAVRDLVRIGLDRVVAYATPETFAAYAGAGGATAQIDEVRFEEVVAHRADPGVAVLDVRRAAEYAAGHMPEAVNVAHTRLGARLSEIPDAEALYVHCQSGIRSAVAAAYLAREGYAVRYVNDAFPHYRELAEVETAASATS
jgi:hydroxyacylglutathione hydrolase